MLTPDELQRLAEEAEVRAKDARRVAYINEKVPKSPFISGEYDWIFSVILAVGFLYGLIIERDQFVPVMGFTICTLGGLSLVISWRQGIYQKKVRKAEAEFNELVRKENIAFHVTDWEYYKNS